MTKDIEIINVLATRLVSELTGDWLYAETKVQLNETSSVSTAKYFLEEGGEPQYELGDYKKNGFTEKVRELWKYTHQRNFVPWNTLILKVTKEGKFNVQYVFDEEYDNRKKFFAKIYPNLGPDRLLARAITKALAGKTWRKIAVTSVYFPSGRVDDWYSLNAETVWEKITPIVSGSILEEYYAFLDDNHQYANHENPVEPFNVVEFQVWNHEEFFMGGDDDEDYYEVNYGLDKEL